MSTVVKQMENGGGGMPACKGTLTPKQINDVSAYVTQKITNKNE
jgi:mono/diheme cytochrome c family protein